MHQVTPVLKKLFNVLINTESIHNYYKESFICLIYKKRGNTQFSNYKPINLVNCDLRLFTKILMNRIYMFTRKMLTINQFGFIPGSQIKDNIMLVNTATQTTKKENQEGKLIFLD